MTTRIVVDLPDHIYRHIESLARQAQRDVNTVAVEVVTRSIQPFPVDANRKAMLREATAFRTLHPTLHRDFAGQHVAIHKGRLVDLDPDPVAFLTRIRNDFPGQTVLRRKVEDEPDAVICFRSTRLKPIQIE